MNDSGCRFLTVMLQTAKELLDVNGQLRVLTTRRQGGSPPPMASLSVLVRRSTAGPPGKLLSALLEGQGVKEGPRLLRWLEGVFSALLGRLGKRGGRERATM